MSKVGRNDKCRCGSGKKYKYCCGIDGAPKLPTNVNRPIRDRNLMMMHAVDDIFKFDKKTTWDDFRKNINDEQVREFYSFMDWLWPLETNVEALLPKPSDKLRGLYIGDIKPDKISTNILRYSLYTDEIVVVNPFPHPRAMSPDYNPILNPGQYKQDTLQMIFFVMSLYNWVGKGIVHLVPNPMDFNYKLRDSFFSSAEARWKDITPEDMESILSEEEKKELEEEGKDMILNTISRMPVDAQKEFIKRHLPSISDTEMNAQIDFIKRQRKANVLWLDQDMPANTPELKAMRLGGNLELGLYLSQLTGSYMYTNRKSQWNEILSVQVNSNDEQDIWSPLTNAFQSLDFQFLDNVNYAFIDRLQEEQRLESFRNYLRRVWESINSPTQASEGTVREFKDELKEQYAIAKEDWKKIDITLRDWLLKKSILNSGAVAGASQILTGNINLIAPMLGFCLDGVNQLLQANDKRKEFKTKVPLSVFIDLENHRP